MGHKRGNGQGCSICASGLKAKVNQALADGHSQRNVLAAYPCFSKGALSRHATSCYRKALLRSNERSEAYYKALAAQEAEEACREAEAIAEAFHRGEPIEEARIEAKDDAEQEYQAPEALGSERGSEPLDASQPAGLLAKQPPPQPRQASASLPSEILPRSPIRAHEDLAGRMQRRVDSLDELGAIAHATAKAQPNAGNVRTAVNANAEAVKAFLIIGRVQGLVQEAPTVDARSINLSAFSADDLRSMLDGLKAGSEALNP